MEKSTSFVITLIVMLSASIESQAELVQFVFSGTVSGTTRGSLVSPGLQIGDSIEGIAIYETGGSPEVLAGSIAHLRQQAPAALSVSLPKAEVMTSQEFIATVLNAESNPGERNFRFVLSDGVALSANGSAGPSLTGDSILVNGDVVSGYLAIGFDDLSSSIRGPEYDLPTEIDLGAFDISSGEIFVEFVDGVGGTNQAKIVFGINEVRSVVPEPSIIQLVAMTGLCFFGHQSRFHCSR